MINSFADWQSLNEIFKWKYVGGENPTYNFDANGVPYEVVFRDDEGGSFEAIYRPKNKEHMDGEGKTGQGIPLSINGTFVDAIRDFLTKNQDWYEVIVHPYDRVRYMMFKREIQKVNLAKDYEIEEVNPIFYITRKQMSKFNEEWTGYEEPEAFTERKMNEDQEDGYGEPDNFSMKHKELIQAIEKRINLPPDFKKSLEALDAVHTFNHELHMLYLRLYHKLYHEINDLDKTNMKFTASPEYRKILKLSDEEYYKQKSDKKTFRISHQEMQRKIIADNLLSHTWKDWENLYNKWIKHIENRRGAIKAKRFGL